MTDMTKGIDALRIRNSLRTLIAVHTQPDGRHLITFKSSTGNHGAYEVSATGSYLYNSDTPHENDVIAKEITRFVNVYADGEAAKQGGCKVHGYAYETESAADSFATKDKRLGGKAIKIVLPMA